MNVWIWHLRQWGRRLGPAGIAGLGLLMVALLLQLVEVDSLQRESRAQHARLAALRQTAARHDAAPVPQPVNPLAQLPPTGEASQLVGELARLARLNGLDLPRGQYSVTSLAGTSLRRWQLALPMSARYPDLHAFLATALERLPNLTIDEHKLKRDRIESSELQVELRMSLFVEATP